MELRAAAAGGSGAETGAGDVFRQQRLAQTQAVSQQDLDNAATEMAVKQAQIGTIDAQIKRNQASLDTAKPISITPASLPRWPGKSRKSPLCKARR
ncbi:hypothetical protein DMI69_20210 [Escherichia coli]|nr:hypothetical protein [Escherichia coli]